MASNEEDIPVLKVSVDNTDEFNDDLDLNESQDDDITDLKDEEDEEKSRSPVQLEDRPLEVDTSKPTLQQRRYENPAGAFVTGMDITSKEVLDKREQRAKRFGIEYNKLPALSEEALKELYESVGVETEGASERGIRLEAIHVRGVDDMSTSDVFKYFAEFGPAEVEWIDDRSCNVVWLESVTAARAMKTLSYDPQTKAETGKKQTQAKKDVKEKEEDPDELNLMSDEEMEEDKPAEEKTDMETDETEKKAERSEGECSTDDEVEEANEKMPPGKWRVGHKFNKLHRLYLRFATKADKKLPGAEGKSKYYQKYGNPNFGGVTGIISASRKRRMMAEMRRLEEEEAKRAVSGRTISPVISNTDNLFDIHSEEIVEGFGVVDDRRKTTQEEVLKAQQECEEGEIAEFGVEPSWKSRGRDRRMQEEDYAEYDEEYEEEDVDPEIVRMEEELAVLLQQTPELDGEDGDGEPRPRRMHADEEEEQILLRRERAKRLQALQAIHKLDSEIRAARKSGRVARQSNTDARARIQARRNQRQQYAPPPLPPALFRTISPTPQREFLSREELEEDELLNQTVSLKNRAPLKVSCEFDRSEEERGGRGSSGKVDYYTATRWKHVERSPSPSPVPVRSRGAQKSKSSSHMDRYNRREQRNVQGRLGRRDQEERYRRRDNYRDNPKTHTSGRQSASSSSRRGNAMTERMHRDRNNERRALKDRLGDERRQPAKPRPQAPPPSSRSPPSSKRGVRRGNMVFVTDSEESVDESEEEVVKIKTEPEDEKWPKLSVHVQSDDDDNFDL